MINATLFSIRFRKLTGILGDEKRKFNHSTRVQILIYRMKAFSKSVMRDLHRGVATLSKKARY
ncbi:MAG: hypothetical protein MUP41_17215, partial [Desulfobacterales bacterium]|nr:hypothetical protein [Desulfobacterales bacterium]